MRHFLKSQTPNFPRKPKSSIVDTFLSIHPSQKRMISFIYGKLATIRRAPLEKIKLAWEKDLSLVLTDTEWDSILKHVNTTSFCAQHCLLQFKVVHRAHMSREKLSRMYPDFSPCCSKCKGDEASLIHMYWSCPSLGKFWSEVFQTLSTVLNLDLAPDPLIALFGIARDVSHLTPNKLRSLSFASLLARRAVLLRWRDVSPPTHSQWLGDIMSCMCLEKIRYSIHNSYKKFLNVWGPFLAHFKSLPSQ